MPEENRDKPLWNIFDSHAHYDSEAFDGDREVLLESMRRDGLRALVNIGCDIESSEFSQRLAEQYDFVYYSVGIHPEYAGSAGNDFEEAVRRAAGHEKCRAIGEIGLDYHYEGYSRERQIYVFEKQLELAAELDLPVVIHSRDASADTMELLKKHRPRGVMHCFSGSAETAEEVVGLGMYVGFTGVVTFKNAKKAKRSAAAVPLDRLVIETDCPYMSPEPNRGMRNYSGNLIHTAAALAVIKGISYEELVRITAENADRLYNITTCSV